MRNFWLPALLVVIVSSPVQADPLPMPGPGGVAVSPDGRLVVSSTACAALGVAGVPGVPGAEYRPGIDAEGKAVAPADLPGAALGPAAGGVAVELSTGLRQRLGVAGTSRLSQRAIIGYVTVEGGQAYLDGAPLAPDDTAALAAACGAARP